MAKERVQKILARAGIASRRKAEELIAEGSVTINGTVAKLGDQAEYGKDAIKVSGKLITSKEALAYLAFNKPKGVISMFGDPQGRPSLADYLGTVKYRLFPVGRLDYNSEGLILLTNDGDFAEKIQRKDDVIRVYHVKVNKHPEPEALARIERGGRVGSRMFKPHSVRLAQEFTKKALVEVAVVGSGAIDLKVFFESRGILVDRVIRVAFGHIRLTDIEPGKFKFLKPTQAEALLEQPELGLRRQQHEEEKARKREPRPEREDEAAEEESNFSSHSTGRSPKRSIPKIVVRRTPGVAPKKRDPGYVKKSDPRYGVLDDRPARSSRSDRAAREERSSRTEKPSRSAAARAAKFGAGRDENRRPIRGATRGPSRIVVKKRDR